jgi:hypothetical protein
MRARPALLLALAVAAGPAAAAPARRTPDASGFLLSARAGWGVPFGDLSRGEPAVEDVVSAKVPIWLELGYRFARRVDGGLYVELAPARVAAAACGAAGACDGYDLRFGLLVHVHLAPARTIDPWLGVGIGVETLQAEVQGSDPAAPAGGEERTWSGIEAPLELGVDARLSPRLKLGPYVSVSLAQFTSHEEQPAAGVSATGSIGRRALHGWMQAGLRATFRL